MPALREHKSRGMRGTAWATSLLTWLLTVVVLLAGRPLSARAYAEIVQADAIHRALQYTGLGAQEQVVVTAERTTVPADDNVPFLQLAGKVVWRVVFKNVRIAVRVGEKTYENPTIRELEVWLDRNTGLLYKVISPFPADESPSTRPALLQRERDVAQGPVRYDGVPTEMPGVDLMEAIQSTEDEGLGGATKAKQIEALYVVWRHTVYGADPDAETLPPPLPCYETPCRRWVITYRYLPPLKDVSVPRGCV